MFVSLLPKWDHCVILTFNVRIIALRTLREFWQEYPDAEQPLRAWYARVTKQSWHFPSDVKQTYGNASFVGSDRIVFNIKGNHYRLVVRIHYLKEIIYIRFIGDHATYDKINVEEV